MSLTHGSRTSPQRLLDDHPHRRADSRRGPASTDGGYVRTRGSRNASLSSRREVYTAGHWSGSEPMVPVPSVEATKGVSSSAGATLSSLLSYTICKVDAMQTAQRGLAKRRCQRAGERPIPLVTSTGVHSDPAGRQRRSMPLATVPTRASSEPILRRMATVRPLGLSPRSSLCPDGRRRSTV